MPLSLSSRSDLFRFHLPITFVPKEIANKWEPILNKLPGVSMTVMDYINESIQGVQFPGVSDLIVQQSQHSYNKIKRNNISDQSRFGKINIEPNQNNSYLSPANPLDKIDRKLNVTFRLNQNMYNYFILYETLFYRIGKPWRYDDDTQWWLDIYDESGLCGVHMIFEQMMMDGIEGLELAYTNTERENKTFQVNFVFNNMNVDLINPSGLPPSK